MKPHLVFLILLTAAGSASHAQSLEAIFRGNMGKNFVLSMERGSTELQGDPYAHNVWAKGLFRTTGNNEYTNVDMKYEAYSGVLVIQYRSDSMVVRADVVREFEYVVSGTTYRFKNGFSDGVTADVAPERYLLVLQEGSWSVYKDIRKEFRKSNFDPTYQTGNRFDWFEERSRYLARSPEGVWTVIRPNQRSVVRLFGRHSRAVEQHMRQNRLDPGNDAHLANIFEFAAGLE